MKKIIAFILVLTLSVFCFAACTKEDPETPEAPENKPTPPARTTVTKDEWDANFQATNFTIVGKMGDETALLKQTDNACYMESNEEGGAYYVIADGKTYCVSQEAGKWEAVESEEWEPRALAIWSMNADIPFESFTYDETTKSYIYTIEHATATVCFEDGVVKSLTITYASDPSDTDPDMTRSFTFSNIGTTTISVPQYEIVDPA